MFVYIFIYTLLRIHVIVIVVYFFDDGMMGPIGQVLVGPKSFHRSDYYCCAFAIDLIVFDTVY